MYGCWPARSKGANNWRKNEEEEWVNCGEFNEFALAFFSIDFTDYMYLYELAAHNDLKTLCIMS